MDKKEILVIFTDRSEMLNVRDQLIRKHSEEKTLVSYSDTTVFTAKEVFSFIVVLPEINGLGPVGEKYVDASRLLKALDKKMSIVSNYHNSELYLDDKNNLFLKLPRQKEALEGDLRVPKGEDGPNDLSEENILFGQPGKATNKDNEQVPDEFIKKD